MRLFDLIKIWQPDCTPENTKVHLARHNGIEDPLDVFLAGEFEDWQRWQSQHHFNREYVVSLIQAKPGTRWLFAGLYRPTGKEWFEATANQGAHFWYDLERVAAADEWLGRLFVGSAYNARHSRPTGEHLADDLTVLELLPERLTVGDLGTGISGCLPCLLGKALSADRHHGGELWSYLLCHPDGGMDYLPSNTTSAA